MKLNKDYLQIMRAGKNWTLMQPKRNSYFGIVLAALIIMALVFVLIKVISR